MKAAIEYSDNQRTITGPNTNGPSHSKDRYIKSKMLSDQPMSNSEFNALLGS
jgi:hypothetical protein